MFKVTLMPWLRKVWGKMTKQTPRVSAEVVRNPELYQQALVHYLEQGMSIDISCKRQ